MSPTTKKTTGGAKAPAPAPAEMPPATPELSYEQARAELTQVVAALESGGTPLAEAVELWKRGEQLANICQYWLDGAQAALAGATPDEPPAED